LEQEDQQHLVLVLHQLHQEIILQDLDLRLSLEVVVQQQGQVQLVDQVVEQEELVVLEQEQQIKEIQEEKLQFQDHLG
jgi:hypothetical protein